MLLLITIEPPADETSRRRHGFYKRLGFVDNPGIRHRQPRYRAGGADIPMALLSHPAMISPEQYHAFKTAQTTDMLAHLRQA